MDWWARTMPLDWKLVSVKFVGLGRAFPTFNLGFWKSFFFSCFFLALDPIVPESVCSVWVRTVSFCCGGLVGYRSSRIYRLNAKTLV